MVFGRSLKDVKDESLSALPKHADAVILGGGVMGCSTLYHLTKHGVKNSILIEKDQLTAGTTWHTAGKSLFKSPTKRNYEPFVHWGQYFIAA